MERSPSSKISLSSDSSAESIVDSALETPLDTQHPFPLNTFVAPKMPVKSLSSRLNLLPKRSISVLDPSSGRPQTAPYSKHDEPHPSRRMRRGTNESTSSMASHSSHASLLRRTLVLVTSSTSSSRPYSALATPSFLTPRTSISSLASTSLGSPTASLSSNRRTALNVALCASPISTSPVTLAADPTTALAPTNSNSLAQFSPTPRATPSLLQFGIPTQAQTASNAATDRNGSGVGRTGSHGAEVRRRRSRDAARRASDQQYDNDFAVCPQKATSPTGWLADPGRDLPSISRALEPDSLDSSMNLGGSQMSLKSSPVTRSNSAGLSILGTWDARVVVPRQEIATTPRPAFPIEPKAHQPWLWQKEEVTRVVGLDKGKARAPAKAAHLQGFPSLQRSSSAPAPALTNGRRHSPMVGVMAREKKFDSNLPSLAAIESGSRLMRGKIVCATCGERGPDFPRCGRCGEAWCSRGCRVEANKDTDGKHRCSPSVA